MTNIITMPKIISKLTKAKLGFTKAYIRKNGLPSWWDKELDTKPIAVLEGAGYIADRLGLDLKSLLSADIEVKIEPQPETKCKKRVNQDDINPKIQIAQVLAGRIAEMVAYGTEVEFTSLPSDAKEIREEILKEHSTINLASILNYCWKKGIAVAYFNNFPKNVKKFDGMIQWRSNRPVIVICSGEKCSAKLAFILAHELGHLALVHITEGTLIDEKIDFNSLEIEEAEANQFAVDLLLAECDNCLGDKPFHNRNHLIKHLKIKVEEHPTIDPGILAFNYAWHNNNWEMANKAFETLYPFDNGQKTINEHLSAQLDWDKYNDDSYEYLEKVLEV